MGIKLDMSSPINYTIKDPEITAITISQASGPVVKIHTDGKIEYFGPVDNAAEEFLKSLGLIINKKYCSERLAKEALYKKLHAIMDNIEGMTKEQLISYLQEIEEDTYKSLTWVILNEREFE